ncbi:MAG: hypothetical protein OIF35_04510 [Cellvibrionaceae bacterium]|nr:hypothetical protein [Cellvibrionaceae bacterium]
MGEHTKEWFGVKPADFAIYAGFILLVLAQYIDAPIVVVTLLLLGLLFCLLSCWLGMSPNPVLDDFTNYIKLAAYPVLTLHYLMFADLFGWNLIALSMVMALLAGLLLRAVSGWRDMLRQQCAYGDAKMLALLRNAKDYQGLKATMASEEDNEARYFICVSISRLFPIRYLKAWVAAEPCNADAWLCYGACMLQRSWEARDSSQSVEISSARTRRFYSSLEQTRTALNRCVELNSKDPVPWAYLIMVATWSGDEIADRVAYFEQAVERDNNSWAAHLHMIIALSEKCGGDNETMVNFANQVVARAAEGSDLPIVLLKAYIEYWKYLDAFLEEHQQAHEFLHDENIRNSALAAYQKSLGSAAHVNTATTVFARYNASSWFWAVRNKDILKKELTILGDRIEDVHWTWVMSGGGLEEARKFAGVRTEKARRALGHL